MSMCPGPKAEKLIFQCNENEPLGMHLPLPALESICKRMITTILLCLPNATRGAVYLVRPIEESGVIRIASGIRNGQNDEISWNVTDSLDYAGTNQVWEDYRVPSQGILQAIARCVETQKSWTSDGGEGDIQKARKQQRERVTEDCHHMEPVLVHLADLRDINAPPGVCQRGVQGKPVNQNEYTTVAVIQIHFKPGAVKQGDRSTRVIKLLSQTLSSEMLSLHEKTVVFEKEMGLVKERKEIGDNLAHDFRNIMAGLGFAYRAVNNEIGYLRESWECLIQQLLPDLPSKRVILEELNDLLQQIKARYDSLSDSYEITRLYQYQNQMLECCFLPAQNEFYLQQKIRPLWNAILSKVDAEPKIVAQIKILLKSLKESFYVVLEPDIINMINHLPKKTKQDWVRLAYSEINGKRAILFDQYIEFLNNEQIGIYRQSYSQKNLIYLKKLVELIPEVEIKLNNSLKLLQKNNNLSEPV